jgi:predicted transcriptional regulator
MSVHSSKDRILEALKDLPVDATVEDAIERLLFLARVEAGLNELDAGKGVPHDEAKRRLGLGS